MQVQKMVFFGTWMAQSYMPARKRSINPQRRKHCARNRNIRLLRVCNTDQSTKQNTGVDLSNWFRITDSCGPQKNKCLEKTEGYRILAKESCKCHFIYYSKVSLIFSFELQFFFHFFFFSVQLSVGCTSFNECVDGPDPWTILADQAFYLPMPGGNNHASLIIRNFCRRMLNTKGHSVTLSCLTTLFEHRKDFIGRLQKSEHIPDYHKRQLLKQTLKYCPDLQSGRVFSLFTVTLYHYSD